MKFSMKQALKAYWTETNNLKKKLKSSKKKKAFVPIVKLFKNNLKILNLNTTI